MIEGLGGSPGNVTRIANLYEGSTGKKLGALPTQRTIGLMADCSTSTPPGQS